MKQHLAYLCTDINETGLSLVIFLGVEQFLRGVFLFGRVYLTVAVYIIHCLKHNPMQKRLKTRTVYNEKLSFSK